MKEKTLKKLTEEEMREINGGNYSGGYWMYVDGEWVWVEISR